VQHLALRPQLLDGTGDILDGNLRVDAVLVKEVDAIRAQAPQHALDDQFDVLGAAVEARAALPGLEVDVPAELRRDDDLIAKWGDALSEDAFHLVIPSMPGYGFSERPSTVGWGPQRIADAYITLMERLGYTKYGAQGGDWGSVVVELMALREPPGLIGIHANMPGVVPPDLDLAMFRREPIPANLSGDEKKAAEQKKGSN
jgi:hypothetical protein